MCMKASFNYVSINDCSIVGRNVGNITMSRGRMLEYTSRDMERRLESLDSNAIAYLKTLPTFLC